MTSDSNYSVRRPDWAQEIPGLINVPRDKGDRRPPRRGPRKGPAEPPPPPPQSAQTPPQDDDGESHLVDYLA